MSREHLWGDKQCWQNCLHAKSTFKRQSQSPRAPEESTRAPKDENNDVAQSSRRGSQKHGSLPPKGRLNKLHFHRAKMESEIPVSPPGFTRLGTKLLHRFTTPKFMGLVNNCSSGSSQGRGRMSWDKPFPFLKTPGLQSAKWDSISGLKCEFESSVSLE